MSTMKGPKDSQQSSTEVEFHFNNSQWHSRGPDEPKSLPQELGSYVKDGKTKSGNKGIIPEPKQYFKDMYSHCNSRIFRAII